MRHPPMQPGWIDAPHREAELGCFALESGECIEDLHLSYVVHGNLEDRSKPVILGLCAIGSTHHRLDFLLGADRALDPGRYTVVVIDALGNGLSSSPSNSATQSGKTVSTLLDSRHGSKPEAVTRPSSCRKTACCGRSLDGRYAGFTMGSILSRCHVPYRRAHANGENRTLVKGDE